MERKQLRIGMLGTGWMCRTHCHAYSTANYMYNSDRWQANLSAVAGSSPAKGAAAAERYGFVRSAANWQELASAADVDVFDNVAPDALHVEPTIAAMLSGKHVVCEKPIAVSVEDARRMLDVAREMGVKNLCCFSYRFMPAVRLSYELIRSGALGRIYHFAGTYYQDQGSSPETPLEKVWYAVGSGVDQGIATHMIDMARFLVGEICSVSGMVKTYVRRRDSRAGEVDINATEGFFTLLEFDTDATGVMQSLGVANGKQSEFSFEIFGSGGSLRWDMADPNNLYVYLKEHADPRVVGWTKVCVTEANHPFMDVWWPKGHLVGWESGHVNMLAHFLRCVATGESVAPLGATFEDGLRAAAVIEAAHQSAQSGRRVLMDR